MRGKPISRRLPASTAASPKGLDEPTIIPHNRIDLIFIETLFGHPAWAGRLALLDPSWGWALGTGGASEPVGKKGADQMFAKTRVVALATVALFLIAGVAATTAEAAGPYWRVNGARLETKARQIKLQSKGLITIKAPSLSFTITCKTGISEGATIEGNMTNQGQDKGRFSFTQCITSIVGCNVTEPIVTNPIKSFLAEATTQTTIVDVFQEAQGPLAKINLTGAPCGVFQGDNSLEGSFAAEIIPAGVEVQELLLSFPATAITSIKHEGIERTVALKFSSLRGVFSSVFGTRLAFVEPFGAFLT